MKKLILLFIILLLIGCKKEKKEKIEIEQPKVTYMVECTKTHFVVAYGTNSYFKDTVEVFGNTWEYSYTPESGIIVAFYAISVNESSTIRGKMYYDGVLIKDTSNTCAYTSVYIEYLIP